MTNKQRITLYHASDKIIKPEDIRFPGPRNNCDFGSGFYLTEDKQIAEEWVSNIISPVINIYEYTADDASPMLHLCGEDWIRVILGFRRQLFNVHFASNIIYGSIADDRLFPSLDQFIEGTIGDKRLKKCLKLVKLGNQYCFKNKAQGLIYKSSYVLEDVQQAADRYRARKIGMKSSLQDIIENQPPGEKFARHYIEMGDWHEV